MMRLRGRREFGVATLTSPRKGSPGARMLDNFGRIVVVVDPGERQSEILGQLDAADEESMFPALNNGYYYAIDCRLHAYSDVERWALIVETVGYNPRARNVLDVLHVFGNCLTTGNAGFEEDDFHERVDNMSDVEDEDLPERYTGCAPIVVRGVALTVDVAPGEELETTFRRLTPEHRDLLLATEAELRRRIPSDLPEILWLDEWHHPNLVGARPSESESFTQLATVLATADPSYYRPALPANTHWTNWPDSGSL